MLIGLVGKAGSGKDTVADILVRDHGFCKIAIADPLKRILKEVFAFSDEQLWGPSRLRDAPDPRYPRTAEARAFMTCGVAELKAKLDAKWLEAIETEFGESCTYHFLTPRRAAQRLGTEFGRECFADVWIDKTLQIAGRLLDGSGWWQYDARTGIVKNSMFESTSYRGVVISDVRFPNEVAAIRAAGGHLWRTVHGRGLEGAAGEHESEQHIDRLEVDATAPDSTLEALPLIVTTMLKEISR